MLHRFVSLSGLTLLLVFFLLAGQNTFILAAPESTEDQPLRTEAPQPEQAPDPFKVERAPLVERLLKDDLLSEEQRRQLALFHGQWDNLGEMADWQINERASFALQSGDALNHVFDEPQVDPKLRARAMLLRGEPQVVEALLQNDTSIEAIYLTAIALEEQGKMAEAVGRLQPLRSRLEQETVRSASELTAAAEALVMLARLEGQPDVDYFLAMDLLGRVRKDIAPFYWPASLAEARILNSKQNRAESFEAWREALSFNPNNAGIWYTAGRFVLDTYDFDNTQKAVEKLYELSLDGPLGMMLEARSLLRQREYDQAVAKLESARDFYPNHREILSLLAAAYRLNGDLASFERVVQTFEKLAPGNPMLALTTAVMLSEARQYVDSLAMFEEAIRRQPNSAEAYVELGLMLMQKGDDEASATALRRATKLDPFHVRAANQLKLVEELLTWDKLESDHFVIAFKPGIDRVLAQDMLVELEKIYDQVTEMFEHQPERQTRIDLMPDKSWFAVRITGMSDIWTIAAATGDVLSMTPPRAGENQAGPYHWPTVLQHEYAHTVTLSQTRNRIPHWFTEACAVAMEYTGRSYDTYELLSWALAEDKLFALNEINWGFIRPEKPYERSLAYQQAEWMLEYILERFGHDAMVKMLEAFGRGDSQPEVFQSVLGETEAGFLEAFKLWAADEVEAWGMGESKLPAETQLILENSPQSITGDKLQALLAEYPDEPVLLRRAAEHAMAMEDPETAKRAVLAYAGARPVDPWVQKQLLELARRTGDSAAAVGPLQTLDRAAMDTGVWALQLARIHQSEQRYAAAESAIRRALWREPYNATYREMLATLSLQQRELRSAMQAIEALTILEPTVAQHWLRLAAIAKKLGNDVKANEAALKAKALDERLNVEKFLLPAS